MHAYITFSPVFTVLKLHNELLFIRSLSPNMEETYFLKAATNRYCHERLLEHLNSLLTIFLDPFQRYLRKCMFKEPHLCEEIPKQTNIFYLPSTRSKIPHDVTSDVKNTFNSVFFFHAFVMQHVFMNFWFKTN